MNSSNKTLWMGNLPNWIDTDNLYSFLQKANIYPQKISIKNLSNNNKCAFLRFSSNNIAENILNKYNGKIINGIKFILNWSNIPITKYNTNLITKFTVSTYIYPNYLIYYSYLLEILINQFLLILSKNISKINIHLSLVLNLLLMLKQDVQKDMLSLNLLTIMSFRNL